MDTTETITHLPLCSGYDGIGLGFKRIWDNVREIAHVEIEGFAAANLVAKMEAGEMVPAPVWTDLKTFPAWAFRGCVDILSAGFPCQPFSAAGKGGADADPRHLWPYVRQTIGLIRPRMVVLENVEGIISAKLKGGDWHDPEGTPVLLHVLRELERTGYRCTWGVFSASEVGAPHQRKRVFILGVDDTGSSKFGRLSNIWRQENSATRKPSEAVANSESLPRWCMPQRTQEEFTQSGSSSMAGTDSIYRSTLPERWEHDAEAGHAGEKLADSKSERTSGEAWASSKEARGSGGSLSREPEWPGVRSEELADPNNCGGREDRQSTELWSTRVDQSSRSARNESESPEKEQESCWPARPGEPQHEWEEPRTIEPGLGGAVDGNSSRVDPTAHRVDRLRLLGNGVVPATAERAVRLLLNKLAKEDQ